jgi:phosphoribosylformylglycinamidine synthase
MKETVTTLIITGFGLNCEKETAKAFEMHGADTKLVHLNDLLAKNVKLEDFQILAFIGGFSFGDHLGAGTVFANKIKFKLKEDLDAFIKDGKLIIGICNGFQTLTRLGLLPALDGIYFKQEVALAHNDSNLFRDDWVYLKANSDSKCVFTKNIDQIRLPIRHGEGKFVADSDVIDSIMNKNLHVLQYCTEDGNPKCEFPENPNGSINSIAGICDETGRVFGMMPHPEAFLSPFNAPDWNLKKLQGELPESGAGVVFFKNAVEYARDNLI